MKDEAMLDSVDKALARIEIIEPELSPEIEGNTSLDFLQAIYRSADQPMTRRMRAAIAALPFEHPKLSVTANVGPNINFALKLERAIKIARGEPLVIDGEAERIGEVNN
jgi:hypothetical protein